MNTDPKPALQDRIDAEAAAWLARLQGSRRSADSERGLKAWLQADPAHLRAFERATELWDLLPGAAELGVAASSGDRRMPQRWTQGAQRFAQAACVVACLAAGAVYLWLHRQPAFDTEPGQQQVTVLQDGTRVALNTDSHLTVEFRDAERRVVLDRGEAMFEVAHDAARPFIVVSGDEQVRALGTTFVVRRDTGRLAVTLLEGSVEVSRVDPVSLERIAILAPGERVTVSGTAGAALDKPSLDAVVAWRRGEVMFHDTTLLDAATELNRYGRVRVVVADPSLAALRVSGVFSTKDAGEFASAIARLYGLAVQRDGERLRLVRP